MKRAVVGLGLALVKHILNRHQGRLTIDSKEGEGATFTVRLPLEDRHASEWEPVERTEAILTDD